MIISLSFGCNFYIPQVHAAERPVIYFLPHQDDEMWLAGSIKQNLMSGRDVHVVMITDGGNDTNTRNILYGTRPCYDRDDTATRKRNGYYYHIPTAEGYRPFTRRRFSAARNVEFYNAMRTLGIAATNIHFANQDVNPKVLSGETYATGWNYPRFLDGSMTSDLASIAIKYYFNKFGRGDYYALATGASFIFSNYEHTDHKAIFWALWNFPYVSSKHYFGNIENKYTQKIPLPKEIMQSKTSALNQYYVWNPRNGRYAIGEHSAKIVLDVWKSAAQNFQYQITEPVSAQPNPTNATIILSQNHPTIAWANPTNRYFWE